MALPSGVILGKETARMLVLKKKKKKNEFSDDSEGKPWSMEFWTCPVMHSRARSQQGSRARSQDTWFHLQGIKLYITSTLWPMPRI